MKYDYNVIKKKVIFAINIFFKIDSFLFEKNVNERSISHKLAEYLQQQFPEWHVDCEYNRNFDEPKKLEIPKDEVNWDDTEAKTVFPDIIIHHRYTNDNLLIIEIKKSNSNVDRIFDKNKLESFGKLYHSYDFGLFLEFNVGKDFNKEYIMECYEKGVKKK